jgi:capsular exopolysaccharide synthesis family protein
MNKDNLNDKEPSRDIQIAEEFPVAFPIDYPQQEQEEEMHLWDYLNVLLRRKWTAITFFLVVVITVTIGTFLMTPIYRGAITIKIDKENPNVLKFKDVYEVDRIEDDYYQTQYKILKSRALAKRVIRSMNLDQNPEFAGKKAALLKGNIADKAAAEPSEDVSAGAAEEIDSAVVDRYLARLSVEPLPKTRLVKVSFDSPSPELAAQVANTIGKAYIDFTIETRFDATQQANEWLDKQLQDMKAKVEKSEEMLNKYASEQGIIFVGESDATGQKDTHKENIVEKKLEELSTQLVQATSDRIAKEALYREALKGGADSATAVLSNPLIQALKKDYVTMDAEYSQLSKVWKANSPKMVRLKEQMNQTKTKIDDEIARMASSTKKDYEAAVMRENSLRSTLESYKGEALKFNDKMVQYQILQREAETNRELYNSLLQRLKETGVSASMASTNIQILDRAELPRKPSKPKKALNILLAVIVGLFSGVGLAFFVDYLDNTVKNPDDVEKGLSLPSLGLVPDIPDKVENIRRMITLEDKKSPLSEAYRSIGTYIQFSSAGRPPKTMIVTSAKQGEGKTTTVINTAITMAHSYGRGIIIDTDMRKPQIHRVFDLDNSGGLSAFLSGNIEFDHGLLIQETKIPNLDVITSGMIPPNPSELLSSARMKDLINGLLPLYSFIILDTPPLLGLSDALILSTLTDGAVMVVRAGETPKNAVTQGKKLLRGVNTKILGVVLNGFRESDLKYSAYSYYNEYYYYEYGADNQKDRKKIKRA